MEVCRQYRSRRQRPRVRRQRPRVRRPREPFYGVADLNTRTVYVNDPSNIEGVGALLDRGPSRYRHHAVHGMTPLTPGAPF